MYVLTLEMVGTSLKSMLIVLVQPLHSKHEVSPGSLSPAPFIIVPAAVEAEERRLAVLCVKVVSFGCKEALRRMVIRLRVLGLRISL